MLAHSERALEVFTEAVQLPAWERVVFLDRACAGENKLRLKVDALLRSNDRAGDFLEHPPTGSISSGRNKVAVGEKPGDRVGQYKLLRQIGEGGCGIVFMAEQEEPVRRRVALKMIKPGMDTKHVIARFERERQALALMDHPNIAKIFDAGATQSGRPYFVMELVRGIKIAEYCDKHSLTTKERLKLFIPVCRALQHAHQKGIIHRDIKPSNILVTETERHDPLPVVIDFGIAKAATNQQLTGKTLVTAFELFIGTPAYMSPEQAAMTNLDIDTRTDIYSLGVLLYELLTGSTPFDTEELLKAGLDEIRRVIREEEPIIPSARLSNLTDADLKTLAQRRRSEPPTLIRGVHGDLDWIVMKAMEKDRTHRYATANCLAADIQRFLANETVSARRPSKIYRVQKLVLRNKLLLISIGIVALLLILSMTIISSLLAKERRSRREAEAATVKSQEITRFLEGMLNGFGHSISRGRDIKMLREILDEMNERAGHTMNHQPGLEAELRATTAQPYAEISSASKEKQSERKTRVTRTKLFGEESPEAGEWLNQLGDENAHSLLLLNSPAETYRDQLWHAEAEPMTREALQKRRKIFGDNDPRLTSALDDLAWTLNEMYRYEEAQSLTREELSIQQKLPVDRHPDVSRNF